MSRRRVPAVLLAVLAAALCGPLLAPPPAYAKPRMPTDRQIATAQQAVRRQAAAVGRLSARVAAQDAAIRRLQDLAELEGVSASRSRPTPLFLVVGCLAYGTAMTTPAHLVNENGGFIRSCNHDAPFGLTTDG